jgi:hypothetical protein
MMNGRRSPRATSDKQYRQYIHYIIKCQSLVIARVPVNHHCRFHSRAYVYAYFYVEELQTAVNAGYH